MTSSVQFDSKGNLRHFLTIEGLSRQALVEILDAADSFISIGERQIRKVPILRGRTLVNLFFEDSTRTRTTFEIAAKRLSADVINLNPARLSTNKGERILDTIRTLEAMHTDIFVIRDNVRGTSHLVAKHVPSHVHIINAGDGTHEHPTQALLDMMSIKEKFGKLKGLKIAIVGDIIHSRVALSNIYGLQKMGAKVTLCGPPHLIPRGIHELGVSVNTDIDEVIEWADALNVLRIQRERMGVGIIPSVREYRDFFGITQERLDIHKKEIVIMHPGPMNRGVEIDSSVADGDQAIILDQVLNGVAVRMSVLYLLLGSKDFE